MISATRGLSASSWEGGAGAEPAVQKWASGCFRHSRTFPTTYTTSTTACWHGELHLTTTACWHGELHLTTTACWHGELHLTKTACWRPTAPPASPLPPLAYIDILCVKLPDARFAQKTRPFRAPRSFWMGHIRCAFGMADWLNRLRAFIIYTVFLIKKKKCKKSLVASATSSVAFHWCCLRLLS